LPFELCEPRKVIQSLIEIGSRQLSTDVTNESYLLVSPPKTPSRRSGGEIGSPIGTSTQQRIPSKE